MSSANKKIDIKKETISAVRNIDYARLRDYSIAELLRYELTSTAFFLMKDGYLGKSKKSELVREIEKSLEVVSTADVSRNDNMTVITIDFMAYICPQSSGGKLNLVTCDDVFKATMEDF